MKLPKTGFVLIVGNMFGGKSNEMVHLLNLEKTMKRNVQAFKVSWDDRHEMDRIKTHNGAEYPALAVPNTYSLIERLNSETKVMGIDELHFFDDPIKDFITENMRNYLIIATALQLDFRGNPFPLRSPLQKEKDSEIHIGHLMPFAQIIPRYPQCTYEKEGVICREEALYPQRFKPDRSLAPYSDLTIRVGGKDIYEARCREHFIRPI